MIESKKTDIIVDCISLMLRPIIRFSLQHAIKIQDILEVVKLIFIQIAEEECLRNDQTVSVSKLSVMTGVHRKDVTRIWKEKGVIKLQTNLIARIIWHWQQSLEFTTSSGKPRVLTVEGGNSEFVKLVGSVSGDLNPYTVLYEMERNKVVIKGPRGIKLNTEVFVPKEDLMYGYKLLSKDVSCLIESVCENLSEGMTQPNLHISTEYNNVRVEALPLIRNWLLKEGTAFHSRARQFISKYDEDICPTGEEAKAKVNVGAFSLTKIEEHLK